MSRAVAPRFPLVMVVDAGGPGLPTAAASAASCSHECKREKRSCMAAVRASLLSLLSRSVSNRAH